MVKSLLHLHIIYRKITQGTNPQLESVFFDVKIRCMVRWGSQGVSSFFHASQKDEKAAAVGHSEHEADQLVPATARTGEQ